MAKKSWAKLANVNFCQKNVNINMSLAPMKLYKILSQGRSKHFSRLFWLILHVEVTPEIWKIVPLRCLVSHAFGIIQFISCMSSKHFAISYHDRSSETLWIIFDSWEKNSQALFLKMLRPYHIKLDNKYLANDLSSE